MSFLKQKKVLIAIIAVVLVAAIALVVILTNRKNDEAKEKIKIGIPSDGTNLSRGIKLLETAGLIKVKAEAGYTPTIADITEYLYNIEVVPVQANTLPSTLADFGASTINGTYAIPNGLIPSKDGLIIEKQSESGDNPYINIIAARAEDAENETFKTIVNAYQTQLVAEFLLTKYKEAFFPAFPYDSNITMTDEDVKAILAYESDPTDKTVVTVGVCGADNDQWKAVQKVLDDQGANIYIKLKMFDAYNLPNEALNAGEIDLNAFQHKAYLNSDAEKNGYKVVAIGDTLIAPLTLYSQKYKTVDELKDAAGAVQK